MTSLQQRIPQPIKSLLRPVKRRVDGLAKQRVAKQVFENWTDYIRAGQVRDDGETVLVTKSGLKIAVRHNKWDAVIVEEQFIDRDYLEGFTPPSGRPAVVVDVGGYIGDFALYCAHELGARVVAYEPTAENAEMFRKNLALNPQLAGRVTLVEKGMSSQPTIATNVQVIGREVHSSSQWYADEPDAEQRTFDCDTLKDALDRHRLDRVDLLKVDCEGGEYDIFAGVDADTYRRIDAMVFEWHRVPGWEEKLPVLEGHLRDAGFSLRRRGQLMYATR